MLNSGWKKIALCVTKKQYSNSRVVRKIFSERKKKKNHTPPLQVKWSVPYSQLIKLV